MAETVGSLVDKISICELRIWHTQEILDDPDADPDAKSKCTVRMSVIQEQRDDLRDELQGVWEYIQGGGHPPKVYRQYKMYNDDKLREGSSKGHD